ncbi:DEKNAAC101429 [Brettanomyces naardenensis]|uniref:DEKNAAC101429 n=1 Tax=Brettanomyces naardenensis TaxID=13370 RepID=A0A448YI62_BRENA|nr:DEKNAAC101429 [Brettanomyces naardenensis]
MSDQVPLEPPTGSSLGPSSQEGAPSEGLDFMTDANSAIQSSLQQKKPLVMLISADSEDSRSWIDARLSNSNKAFATKIKPFLATHFVLLKILQSTPDFQFLLQLFPQFATIQVPAVLIVDKGQIVDLVPRDVNVEEFNERVEKVKGVGKGAGAEPVPNVQHTPPVHSSPVPPSPVHASPAAQASPDVPLARRTSHPSHSRHSSKTLKEEAAELAASRYRENLAKHQRDELVEKERILRMVRFDRKEREQDEIFDRREEPEQPVHENLHNTHLEMEPDYVIQVRLLDGKAARPKFPRNEKLLKVREYILQHYPSYRDVPFYFYKSVDRVTFHEADEEKSLAELKLNRATLLVKPLDPFERRREDARRNGMTGEGNASITGEFGASASGTLSWLKNRLGGYLWGNADPTEESMSMPLPPVRHSRPLYHDSVEDIDDNEGTRSSFNLYSQPGLIDEPRARKEKPKDVEKRKEDKRPQLSAHGSFSKGNAS